MLNFKWSTKKFNFIRTLAIRTNKSFRQLVHCGKVIENWYDWHAIFTFFYMYTNTQDSRFKFQVWHQNLSKIANLSYSKSFFTVKKSVNVTYFTLFFTAVYIVERLVCRYVLNKAILQFLSLKSAVYNQELFQIKSGL